MDIGTKKALGIITCKSEKFYNEILETTPFEKVDKVYVIDSSPDKEKYVKPNDKIEVIPCKGLRTVGYSKNRLWERMIEDGMDHLYLQEGDVKIIDDNVFDAYLETAKNSGVWGSLSYAWHGNGNKDKNGFMERKTRIDYSSDVSIDFTKNGLAAFTYHNAKVIENIGMMDEIYVNAWEHLDHYQRVAEKKWGPYWWWFTDIKDSFRYIEDLDDGSHGGSVIRKDEVWLHNFKKGAGIFKSKFGHIPVKMPLASIDQILERMNLLYDNFAVK